MSIYLKYFLIHVFNWKEYKFQVSKELGDYCLIMCSPTLAIWSCSFLSLSLLFHLLYHFYFSFPVIFPFFFLSFLCFSFSFSFFFLFFLLSPLENLITRCGFEKFLQRGVIEEWRRRLYGLFSPLRWVQWAPLRKPTLGLTQQLHNLSPAWLLIFHKVW